MGSSCQSNSGQVEDVLSLIYFLADIALKPQFKHKVCSRVCVQCWLHSVCVCTCVCIICKFCQLNYFAMPLFTTRRCQSWLWLPLNWLKDGKVTRQSVAWFGTISFLRVRVKCIATYATLRCKFSSCSTQCWTIIKCRCFVTVLYIPFPHLILYLSVCFRETFYIHYTTF